MVFSLRCRDNIATLHGPHPGHVHAVDCGIAQVPGWLTRDNIATVVASSWPWSCIRCRLWHCSGSGLANQGQHCDSGCPHPGHALSLPLHQNQAPCPDRRGNQGYCAYSFQLKMCLTNVNNIKITSFKVFYFFALVDIGLLKKIEWPYRIASCLSTFYKKHRTVPPSTCTFLARSAVS